MVKKVVIIGGSYAGIAAAKEIFSKGDKSIHLTVISSSSKSFYNISSPRIIVEPQHTDKVFFNVKDTLKKYSNGIPFEFIHGSVKSSDFDNNSLSVKVENKINTITYDYLILASGTRTKTPAFKLNGNYDNSIEALKDMTASLDKASRIAVIGGGATGCEVAGEIGYYFGKTKSITLFAGDKGPLSILGEKRSSKVNKKLEELNIVVKNLSVSTYTKNDDKYTINFNDSSTEDYDLVIPAHGIQPNTEYIDKKYLDKRGYVKTDSTLKVEGQTNIFAFGDILAIGEQTVVDLEFQQLPVFKTLVKAVIFDSDDSVINSSYSKGKTTIVVPISKNGGIGVLFGWSIPSFLVKILKSKDFFISKASDTLN